MTHVVLDHLHPGVSERWDIEVVSAMPITPQVAAQLRATDSDPKERLLGVWYGKINAVRQPLAERVLAGDLPAEEARNELGTARPSQSLQTMT